MTVCRQQKTPQINSIVQSVSVLPLTSNLCYHCLRDPPVPQERFDLLFHQAAVPPANTHSTSKNRAVHLYTLSAVKSQAPHTRSSTAFQRTAEFFMDLVRWSNTELTEWHEVRIKRLDDCVARVSAFTFSQFKWTNTCRTAGQAAISSFTKHQLQKLSCWTLQLLMLCSFTSHSDHLIGILCIKWFVCQTIRSVFV